MLSCSLNQVHEALDDEFWEIVQERARTLIGTGGRRCCDRSRPSTARAALRPGDARSITERSRPTGPFRDVERAYLEDVCTGTRPPHRARSRVIL